MPVYAGSGRFRHPQSGRFPKERISPVSGLVPAEHSCAGGLPPPTVSSVIAPVMHTCARTCHSGDQQVIKMESSQPARLGAWLGQVGGKSAPEVKRTLPPKNSAVPSRLARSRCSVNGVEGRGWGPIYSQLLPTSVWAGGFHCKTLLGPEPRGTCLESCGSPSPGSYSETLAWLSPVSEGRVTEENKV